MSRKRIILIAMVFIVSILSPVLAHKVNLFAYAENGMVYTESYFSDGRSVVDSQIEVFDSSTDKLLLTGKTDENGAFSFKIPQATGLRIVLSASMGHKNEYVLSEEEVTAALGKEKPAVQKTPETMKEQKVAAGTLYQESGLEAIIEGIINSKTAPIMQKLTRIEEKVEKPSLQEILGGIGYILGLMGVGLYFKARSKR